MSHFERKIIIPAAGFGTRVGSPEAKELLLHPESKKPLISFSLDIAGALKVSSVVITRKEKINLLNFLKEKQRTHTAEIEVLTVAPTAEWPASLLASQENWADKNILILPDTDFQPIQVVEEMFLLLRDYDVVVAYFAPSKDELKTFGVFAGGESGAFWHCEKPTLLKHNDFEVGSVKAWGLLGFRKAVGKQLFEQMLESTFDHAWRPVPGRVAFLQLSDFRDLTRK